MDSNLQRLIRQRTREIIMEKNILGLEPDQIAPSQLPPSKSVLPELNKAFARAQHQVPVDNEAPTIEGRLEVSVPETVGAGIKKRRTKKAIAEPAPVPLVAPPAPKVKRAPSEHSIMVKEFMKLHPGVKLGEASKAISAARKELAKSQS